LLLSSPSHLGQAAPLLPFSDNGHHYSREEPNVRFSPDKKLVIFTSNLFGPSYVFGAEVEKAVNPPAADVQSTPDLARKFNPVDPPNSKQGMPRIP
jgi:oligogalacturonide lyase